MTTQTNKYTVISKRKECECFNACKFIVTENTANIL